MTKGVVVTGKMLRRIYDDLKKVQLERPTYGINILERFRGIEQLGDFLGAFDQSAKDELRAIFQEIYELPVDSHGAEVVNLFKPNPDAVPLDEHSSGERSPTLFEIINS